MRQDHRGEPSNAAGLSAQLTAQPVAAALEPEFDPFSGGALQRAVATTEAQREVWLADQLGREASLAYNESIGLRLLGALDRTALRAALDDVVAQHEALRATLSADGMQLLVGETQGVALDTAKARGTEALAQAALAMVIEPFDLVRGPLLRATLVEVTAEEQVLLLCAHHIVCDGFSFGVLARDLAQAYNARRAQLAPAWAPAAAFSDYALAEIAHQSSAERSAAEHYWLHRFAALPAPLELPTDRPRPARRSFDSDRIDHLLDAALVTAAKRAAGRDGGSLFALLLAAFSVLLARLGQQDEVVIGVPAAGQNAVGSADLVGHCVNLLPLRVSFDPTRSATAALQAVQSALLDAFEHQRFTFGTLLRKLALERDPARLPLLNVMFNLDQALYGDALGFDGLQAAVESTPRRFENFELFVNATQVSGALRLECQYNTTLFNDASVRAWLAAYETLLRAWVDAPLSECSRLDWVPPAQRARLQQLNARNVPYDTAATLAQVLRAGLSRAGNREVLVAEAARFDGNELLTRSQQLAYALRMRGARRGSLVGLHLPRNAELVVAQLAVLMSGAAYVPLDPAFPAERLRMMADDAQLAVLVSTAADVAELHWTRGQCLLLDADAAAVARAAAVDLAADGARADDPAYVIYTSGSTGQPKGVAVQQRAVVNFLRSMAEQPGLSSGDTLVAVTTLSFDIAVLELMLPLMVSARVVLATREQAADGVALRRLIEANAATVLQATPATWRLLLEAGFHPPSGFKALVGGESLPVELARALLSLDCELWNMYGPTETTVWSTCEAVAEAKAPISIGMPIANTQVWILDERQQLCPLGVPGEICIGGDGLALGYHRRPELTAERFIDDPFATRPLARLYRTGDRGRWTHDGKLQHLGRLDFQVKVRGYRIELGEIEAQLAQHPSIEACVVITREDRPGDVRIVAYALARGELPPAVQLREHLRRMLPDYMIPQHFIALAKLPRLPNGKLDRRRLPPPGEIAQPGPASAAIATSASANEQRVAAAIAVALSLPQVDLDDNFFGLGGHSLLAAQLTSTLSRALGCTVPLRAVFEASTARRLAAWIDREGDSSAAAVEPMRARPGQRTAPLSAMQQRLWFLEQMRPGRPVHNVPSGHRLLGALNQAAFERAFRQMVERQSALRTVIEMQEGEPVQRVLDHIELALFPAEDLSELEQSRRELVLAQRMSELASEPFDLNDGPLARARVFKLAPQEHAFFFMAHHLIWDGWSFDLLYQEMAALYAEACGEEAASLPALSLSYGDFAHWQQQWLKGAEIARQVAHWKALLSGYDSVLELPVDQPRPPVQSGRGRTAQIHVDAATTEMLHRLARQGETTLFVVLLASFTAALRHLVGQHDLVIATPVRGRHRPELEALMGFFVNALPLRLRASNSEPSVRTLLAEVRETVSRSFDSPDVPFEHLVRELKLRRTEERFPLYQAFMSFQDGRGRPTHWGALAHKPDFVPGGVSNEDIGLWLLQLGDGLSGAVVANADILSEASVSTMRDFVVAVLQQLAQCDAGMSVAVLTAAAAQRAALPAAWHEHAARVRIGSGNGSAQEVTAPAMVVQSPSTPDEVKLADIWAKLLGVDGVQATDNFFDLGGHSLLVMRAIAEMERHMGRRVSPRRYIFETLRQIAARGLDDDLEPAARPRGGMLGRLIGSLTGRRSP